MCYMPPSQPTLFFCASTNARNDMYPEGIYGFASGLLVMFELYAL